MPQEIVLTNPDCSKKVTPDGEGRVYLTQDLAKEEVYVYAVRAEDAPDPDVEGAASAIEDVIERVDGAEEQNLRAALAALGRAGQ